MQFTPGALSWLHDTRFQATLTCYEGTSVLRVVETNDFNQLPHITLRFQPGDDAAIKKVSLARTLLRCCRSHAMPSGSRLFTTACWAVPRISAGGGESGPGDNCSSALNLTGVHTAQS